MSSFTFLTFSALTILFFISSYADAEVCAGCPMKQDPNDPEVKQQLTKILSQRNEDGIILRVISVKTQVVNGIKHIVKFEMKNLSTKEVKICETNYVSRPWISKQYFIDKFSCEPVKHNERQLLGTLKDVDENEMNMVSEFADMAVKTLDDIDADDSKRVVSEIIDAKKQLVNGIMYYLNLKVKTTACSENSVNVSSDCLSQEAISQEICKIQIHRSFADSSPLNAKVVKSECGESENLVGHPSQATTESELVKEAAQFAAERINAMSNSIYKQVLLRIVEATSQVVSGLRFNLILELGNTQCMKNMHSSDNCDGISENAEKMICRVSVWSQPWKKTNEKSQMKIISNSCGPFYRAKRSFVGGEVPLDPQNKKIEQLKNYVENQLTSRSNSQYTKTIVKILNATTQVVSGTLTRMSVVVADTNCLKSDNRAVSECSPTEQGRQICKLTIWEQPWIKKKEITQSECHSIQNVGA